MTTVTETEAIGTPPTAKAKGNLALALVLVALEGGSPALGAAFSALPDHSAFLTRNEGEFSMRNAMVVVFLVGALLPLVVALCALAWQRRRAVPYIVKLADLLSPLCLATFVPILVEYRVWSDAPLTFLCGLAAVGLVGERLLARSLGALPDALVAARAQIRIPDSVRRLSPTIVVVAAAVVYALYFSYYTLLNDRRFGTAAFDMGINVNWCYNALHGKPLSCTVLFGTAERNFLANHAIFAMALWLPIYALHPGTSVLLIYQSSMVGLAAVPLYLFARTQIMPWKAAIVAVAYLLYAPVHGPNFYDFHELPVALPWHFLLYFFIATRRTLLAALTVPIILAHREDMAVGVVVLGVFLVLSGARPRFGAWLAGLSLVWFVLIKFVIMPASGSWWFEGIYEDLMPQGKGGYAGIVQTILVNPAYFATTLLKEAKLVYFLHLFAPLIFLPLRRPVLALLALPGFFFTLMTTGYEPTLSIAFQYTTHWIPYLFAGAVLAIRLITEEFGLARARGATLALLAGVVIHSVVFGAIFQHDTFVGGFHHIRFTETDGEKKFFHEFERVISRIPQGASVAATENELPHVAARMKAYSLRFDHGDADYLVIRRDASMNRDTVLAAFERNDYGLVDWYEDQLYLFQKGFPGNVSETEAAKKRLDITTTRRER